MRIPKMLADFPNLTAISICFLHYPTRARSARKAFRFQKGLAESAGKLFGGSIRGEPESHGHRMKLRLSPSKPLYIKSTQSDARLGRHGPDPCFTSYLQCMKTCGPH